MLNLLTKYKQTNKKSHQTTTKNPTPNKSLLGGGNETVKYCVIVFCLFVCLENKYFSVSNWHFIVICIKKYILEKYTKNVTVLFFFFLFLIQKSLKFLKIITFFRKIYQKWILISSNYNARKDQKFNPEFFSFFYEELSQPCITNQLKSAFWTC